MITAASGLNLFYSLLTTGKIQCFLGSLAGFAGKVSAELYFFVSYKITFYDHLLNNFNDSSMKV
jgi:hypothetical protein